MASTAIERKIAHKEKYKQIDIMLETLDFEQKSVAYVQYAKLSKAMAAFQIYRLGENKIKTASLSKDLCKTANKYGLMKYCIEPSEYLFLHYSEYDFDRTKAMKMKALNIESIHTFELEKRANRYYAELVLIRRSKHSKHLLLEQSEKYWGDLKGYLGKINSFDFHKISFMIGLTYFRSKTDWKATEVISLRALRYFESSPLRSDLIIGVYYRQHINAKLTQGDEMGIPELMKRYRSVIKLKSKNWFLFQYTLVRINLIKNNYQEARENIDVTMGTRGFKSISKMNKLAIDLANAYSDYALNYHKDKIHLPRALLLVPDEDMFSDQYKLQLLILRLIYYCHRKEWKLVETNNAAISKFLSRKLIRQDQGRSYNFIKMLLQLSERQYHHLAIKRHTNQYYAKLTAQPCRAVGSEQDYEFIQYERLWDMIMYNLKK